MEIQKLWSGCNGRKKPYMNKKDAETHMNIFRAGYGKKHFKNKPCRVYFCSQCDAWHMTSKPAEFNIQNKGTDRY